MQSRLHSIYAAAQFRLTASLIIIFTALIAGLLGVVFLSPGLVIGCLLATSAAVFTLFRPTWSLGLLLWYLPFEPFLLKWVPDELYVYAKYGSELLVYMIVGVVVWKLLVGELKLTRTRADIPFVLFLITLTASVAINFLPLAPAILGARQILRFILLFFAAVYLAPTKLWIKTVVAGLCVILLIQLGLGVAQAMWGERVDTFLLPGEARTVGDIQLTAGTVQFWDPGQRLFGTLGRYDQLGTFMALVMLIVVAALYEKVGDEGQRRWLWLLILGSLPILALTYSRSSWFGFLLGFLFIAAVIKRDRRVIAASVIVPAILLLYIALTGLVVRELVDLGDQSITERFFEAFSVERWVSEYHGLGRLYWIYQTIVEVVPASPIFGHGPGTYGGGAVAALGNTTLYDELGLPFGVYGTDGYIDNNWFSLWGETGTFGLAAYLWLYISVFLSCLLVYRKSADAETRTFALGVAAAMIALALNAFLATFLEVRTLAPYIWTLSGAVVALGKREKIL